MITNFCDWHSLVVRVPKYIFAVKTEVLNSYTYMKTLSGPASEINEPVPQ